MSTQPARRTWGRKSQANTRWVIARDHGICGICGHPGADTLGHILPALTHPELEHDPANWQAEHGQPHHPHLSGFACPGTYGKGATITGHPPTRDWIGSTTPTPTPEPPPTQHHAQTTTSSSTNTARGSTAPSRNW